MIPSIGRAVIVHGIHSNGATEAPAVITRAWSSLSTEGGPVAVNLTVFPDAAPQIQRTSVMLFHTRQQAMEHCGANPMALAAHWPDL